MTNADQGNANASPLTLEELQAKLDVANKRYTDLQSHHDKTRTGLETENARLMRETTVFTPPKTTEELEDWFKDKPDWKGAIETTAKLIAADTIKPIQDDLNLAKAQTAQAELLQVHPDAGTIYHSENFKTWATAQGPEIQSWLEDEYDSSKVIRALNYYKAMTSTAPTQTFNEPSAADAVSTHTSVVTPQTQGSTRVFTREQIEKMNIREYAANQKDIEEAYAQGNVR